MKQVSEVDKHGHLLLILELSGLKLIVVDLPICLDKLLFSRALDVSLVVRVLLTQLEAITIDYEGGLLGAYLWRKSRKRELIL
jgi:hypothetical protein